MQQKQLSPPVVAAIIAVVVVLVLGFGFVYLSKSSSTGNEGVKKSGLPPGMRGKGDQQTGGVPSMPNR